MNKAFSDFKSHVQNGLKVLGLLLLSLALVFGWTLPVQAASRLSPQLEEQVLQVIRDHPEALVESLQAYQQQQQQQLQQARQAFLQELKPILRK